jgi:hypothetical protein
MLQGPPTTPTEDDEASIPTEHVRNGPNLNRIFTVRHKAAKRTFPWELTADEIQLALPPPHVPRRSLRARLEIDRLGDKARWQELGCNCQAGSGSDEPSGVKADGIMSCIPASTE